MSFAAILLLAMGLAMDATAVAAARGLGARDARWTDALKLAALFGLFQAGMPLIGWAAGARVGPLVAAWDHWIAFVLLGGIGAKMLWEGVRGGEAEAIEGGSFQLRALLVLAVATSIDALAAGVTLPMLHAPLALTIGTIGLTTLVLSFAGVYAGRRFGARLGRRLDAVGGVVLIGMGVRILVQHLRDHV